MITSAVPQLVRDTSRFRQVITILAKYGLARWLTAAPIPWVQTLLRDTEGHQITDLTFEESVRGALTELGTTFIKLGQILSTRADLIGVDLAEELGQLRANVAQEPVESIIQTIEEELGRPISEIYADFENEPVAAASIAQVHRATLADGTQVAVKVQRTNIEEQIRTDLDILMRIASLAESHIRNIRHYQPLSTVSKFRATLLRELDFEREQRNMLEFEHNFVHDNRVQFAKPYRELTTDRVLTMEFLSGTAIDSRQSVEDAGLNPSQLAEDGAKIFLDMIFRDGFYHADPHPGNILVMSDGRIGLLDCGMVGHVESHLRDQIENMLLAVASSDSKRLTRAVIHVGSIPADFDESELASDVESFVAEYANCPVAELDLGNAIREMIELIRRHRITLPAGLTLLLKVLIMLEGTSRLLDPDFSLAELITPYRWQALRRRYSPWQLRKHAEEYANDWGELLKIFPSDMADILNRVKRGKFDVHLDHRRLDSIVNRLVSGVLTAALFMGSSALWSQQVPPLLFGTSVPGLLGCTVSVILSLRIFGEIRRSSRHDESS